MNELTEVETRLSAQEADRFDDLEICIANGLQTFVEVGNALAEIRDGKLYRVHHATFEDYCQNRWGLKRAHAYRMIDAASVISNLSPIGDIPQTESQARPLTSLTPEQQREVWQTAVSTAPNGKVTAAHVESVKREYLHPASQNGNGQPEPPPSTFWDDEYGDYSHDDYYEPPQQVQESYSPSPPATSEEWKPAVPHVSYNSGNNEWYTPAEIIEAARRVMGTIDLDPASSEIANAVVKAGEYFTAEINGLDADWYGNVWLNPPYASDLIGKFCEKIFQEYTRGKVDAALVLVNNATETQWFALLAAAASAICFPSSRVKFWKPEGGTGQPLQGQAVLYFGTDVEAFTREFRGVGFIVEVLNG